MPKLRGDEVWRSGDNRDGLRFPIATQENGVRRNDVPDSEWVMEATGNDAAGPITKCCTKAVKAIAFGLG